MMEWLIPSIRDLFMGIHVRDKQKGLKGVLVFATTLFPVTPIAVTEDKHLCSHTYSHTHKLTYTSGVHERV